MRTETAITIAKPREFEATVEHAIVNSIHGPRIVTVERIDDGEGGTEDDFYLLDDWVIDVLETPDPVRAHLYKIADEAGLEMMRGVFDVLVDRETVDDEKLLTLTAADVPKLYDAWVGPAVDDIENSLNGVYD